MSNIYRKFIKDHWVTCAAVAWAAYLNEGRGALVVLVPPGMLTSGDGSYVSISYLAHCGEDLKLLGGWPHRYVTDLISTYDPKREVIFMFIDEDENVRFYSSDASITPPEAFHKCD